MATATRQHSIGAFLAEGIPDADVFVTEAGRAAVPWDAIATPAPKPAKVPAAYVDKSALATHFGMSVRWIEYRMKDGLPHEYMDGRARFKIGPAEIWLRENGHLKAAD